MTPNELVLTFRGSYVCANFCENRSRNATVRVPTDGQTHTHTHRQTDANRFYNLSHAICYSYGTDNAIMPNNAGNVVLKSVKKCQYVLLHGLLQATPGPPHLANLARWQWVRLSVSATRRHLRTMLAEHSRQINIFSETFQLEYSEILLRRCIECRAV